MTASDDSDRTIRHMSADLQLLDQTGNPRTPSPRYGTVAFWVKENTVIEVETRHVRVIMESPERFGLTHEIVDSAYRDTGEKRGIEGVARAHLIGLANKNGWIRVRHYVNRGNDYWSVQIDEYQKRKKDILRFFVWAKAAKYLYPDDEIRGHLSKQHLVPHRA